MYMIIPQVTNVEYQALFDLATEIELHALRTTSPKSPPLAESQIEADTASSTAATPTSIITRMPTVTSPPFSGPSSRANPLTTEHLSTKPNCTDIVNDKILKAIYLLMPGKHINYSRCPLDIENCETKFVRVITPTSFKNIPFFKTEIGAYKFMEDITSTEKDNASKRFG
ncbi:hypothetical protein Cgig2_019209 [Carnegiea gigantea]|uniref:Uncharacterized protein n=1 Tax=Carnegiea gigantea TaxID=171969 RepID=A0A9Q1GMN5_9CARY|nr:hypothetical protein Cgig2_019209 [Carnegiea gigantea]